jgi:hypothetical protein
VEILTESVERNLLDFANVVESSSVEDALKFLLMNSFLVIAAMV